MRNFLCITLCLLCCAGCSKAEINFSPLYYNVLQLNREQISEFEYLNETKQNIINILDKRQKSQYRIIKHLDNKEKKAKDKDYYKLNPRMSVFGNLDK
ncbi:hypothetical protein J6N69_02365 [bacterium]|nr:hypothetical protein [bacterium]